VLPEWARWRPDGALRPWTVGIEEEVMLLEPRGWTVANRSDEVLSALPSLLGSRASAETHACALELRTGPHAGAAEAGAELASLRAVLEETLRERFDLRAAVAGTHPFAEWRDVAASAGARYQLIHSSMRALARREPTFALHVHVGVPDGEAAVRALDGLRADLPLLLALAANSPFWQGRDTGFAAARIPVFSMFPRVGIPRGFGSYAAYVRTVDGLVRSGAVPDPTFLWWDARLQPRLGTVEVRVMDAQTGCADAAALAALVQCLVRRRAEDATRRPEAWELLDENRFLAARDGMQAELIDPRTGAMRAARDWLADLLEGCADAAQCLGCVPALASAAQLAARTGDVRQRALAEGRTLPELVAALSAEFVAVPPGVPSPGRRMDTCGPSVLVPGCLEEAPTG
jgi:glutamate---cysteine ligase / carboxylate-amine ligase